MKKKVRVGVIFGGRSGEHEVSLRSARSVIHAIDKDVYDVFSIGISQDGKWLAGDDVLLRLERQANPRLLKNKDYFLSMSSETPDTSLILTKQMIDSIDVVFPVLHGPFGEDGSVQGLLETAQIPYVGCGVLASSVAMDKILFKDVIRAHGIPTPDYVPVFREELEDMKDVVGRICRKLEYPIFCKPANLGSSVGITICHSDEELEKGLLTAARYDRRIIVEQGISNAREIEISLLGNSHPETSVPGEIIPSREFYDYEAKYLDEGDEASKLIIPAKIPDAVLESMRKYAVRAFKAIDGAGMARVDFLLDDAKKEIYLNEINTIPGFTSISMYPKLWEASGVSYQELIHKLIQLAFQRFEEKSKNHIEYLPD